MAISSVLGSSALLPAGLGFRNVIINGGFDVWQRGTTAAIPSSPSTSYLADRWSGYRGTTGSTQSRATAGLDGFQYALRIQRDSGNTGTGVIFMNQSFETSVMAKLANKQVTLSFWARAGANYSSSGLSFTARVVAGTGTEANVIYTGVAGSTEPVATTVTLTTSWQRFTATGLIPSGSNGGGVYFFYAPTGTAGAADYVEITGVQLEQNYQPTPFEQRPIGVELALCQRYYYRAGGTAYFNHGWGGTDVGSTVNASLLIWVPIPMRSNTVSLTYANVASQPSGSGTIATPSAITVLTDQSQATAGKITLSVVSSSLVAGGVMRLLNNNNSAGFLALDSEL
jgi:hypothetical protein